MRKHTSPRSLFGNRTASSRRSVTARGSRIGARKLWPATDDTALEAPLYMKKYRLRGRSEHAEIWTAADSDGISRNLRFPDGDCRNDNPERIKVNKQQINYFLRQFEQKMYPRETKWFSKPPRRNGDNARVRLIRRALGVRLSKDHFLGKGKRIVILVDNVRDPNFFDTDNENSLSRTAGFFWNIFNELTDRNIMSIDSYNWLANTTADPPHAPSTDPCSNFPAGPFAYEGVFAHEFQHLLEYYADPNEVLWIDEGLADWAQTLTGFARPGAPPDSPFMHDHIQCFLGSLEHASEYNPIPAENCGPENSLTVWGDQTDNEVEILADYGAAYSFMEMLVDRFGRDAMTFLHRVDSNGLKSLAKLLTREGSSAGAQDVIHEWLRMVATDKLLDGGAMLHGTSGDLEVATLNAMIDWNNDDAYSRPGAPPNGGDYVLARDDNGQRVGADEIANISFDGADALPADPVEWTVDTDKRADNPALYSGSGDNLDRSIVDEVTVPAACCPTLTFDTNFEMEPFFDYGFVQVSTDGGATWTSLANAHTTSQTETGLPISDHLPGFTGTSGGDQPEWVTESFDLSDYMGQTVLLGFRYMTDPAVTLPGWWIDNVKIDDMVVSDGDDLGDWETITEVHPIPIEGFSVQLVAWTDDGTQVWVGRIPLGAGHEGALGGGALDGVIGTTAENVGVIVTYDEPTETITQYAPYELTVDNVDQPGG